MQPREGVAVAKRIIGVIGLVIGLIFGVGALLFLSPALLSGQPWRSMNPMGQGVLALLLGGWLLWMLCFLVCLLTSRRRRAPSSELERMFQDTSSSIGGASSLVQVYHTELVGVGLFNAGRSDRRRPLRRVALGDRVICRAMPSASRKGESLMGVFTHRGEQIGILDPTLLHHIHQTYPRHRVRVVVERIRGGRGIPYACEVWLGVYELSYAIMEGDPFPLDMDRVPRYQTAQVTPKERINEGLTRAIL